MTFRPYADQPLRATVQLLADLTVIAWAVAWVMAGFALHDSLVRLGDVGYAVQSGAGQIAGNLARAGRDVDQVPLAGEPLGAPLRQAGDAASSIARSGQQLGDDITALAVPLSVVAVVAAVLPVVLTWLALRWRFARRAGGAAAALRRPGGERLLALRALATRPARRLVSVADDPVAAWARGDAGVVHRLAVLEARACGVRLR